MQRCMVGFQLTRVWAFIVWVTTLAVLPPRVVAQETPSTSLIGVVVDATGGRLEGVQILLNDTELAALSDGQGSFRVNGITPGPYQFTFFKPGFEVHRYRYLFPDELPGEIDLGAVVLKPLLESLSTLTGTVVDSATAEPVAAAQLRLDDQPAALADASGKFEVRNVKAGFHTLDVRRIGYRPLVVDLEIPVGHPRVEIRIEMNTLPAELEGVVVEGEEPLYGGRKLRRFWKRWQSGIGQFITAFEIEQRNPTVPTDLLENIPGLLLRRGPFGNNAVELARPVQGCASPTFFLDGARVGKNDIDATVNPRDIAGIEIYTRPSQVPAEFNIRGEPSCGVIAVWMR